MMYGTIQSWDALEKSLQTDFRNNQKINENLSNKPAQLKELPTALGDAVSAFLVKKNSVLLTKDAFVYRGCKTISFVYCESNANIAVDWYGRKEIKSVAQALRDEESSKRSTCYTEWLNLCSSDELNRQVKGAVMSWDGTVLAQEIDIVDFDKHHPDGSINVYMHSNNIKSISGPNWGGCGRFIGVKSKDNNELTNVIDTEIASFVMNDIKILSELRGDKIIYQNDEGKFIYDLYKAVGTKIEKQQLTLWRWRDKYFLSYMDGAEYGMDLLEPGRDTINVLSGLSRPATTSLGHQYFTSNLGKSNERTKEFKPLHIHFEQGGKQIMQTASQLVKNAQKQRV